MHTIFAPKNLFLEKWLITGPKGHNMITECPKSLETTIKIGKIALDNNTYLTQIITSDMAKLGPENNFTACT